MIISMFLNIEKFVFSSYLMLLYKIYEILEIIKINL